MELVGPFWTKPFAFWMLPVVMMAQMRSAKMEDSSVGSEMLIQKQDIEQSVQVRFAITEK